MPPTRRPDELASSVDGQTIVTREGGRLQVFDVQQNAIRWQRAKDVECFVLHPRWGLFVALRGEIAQLSLETGAVLRTIVRTSLPVRLLACDPAGASLAWLDDDGAIEVRSLADGKLCWRHEAHAGRTLPASHRPTTFGRVLSFSTDGRYLVTSAREGEWVLALWNAETGARLKTLRGHDKAINGAAFLPDRSLVSWSADGTLRFWNVQRGAIRRILRIQESLPADRGLRGAA
jgi:WD40 repeat protein